jgi:hypothetical protein
MYWVELMCVVCENKSRHYTRLLRRRDGRLGDVVGLRAFNVWRASDYISYQIICNVLHPRTGHTTEPVKIPYGLPLTTNYIHNIRDINTIGTVL